MDNNLLPLPRQERRGRNIAFARRASQKSRPELTNNDIHKIAVEKLVRSAHWDALLDAADKFVGKHSAALPQTGLSDFIGYSVNAIVRDAIFAFLNELEESAKTAPDPANYEANEIQ